MKQVKSLYLNMPFNEAIAKMPKYPKFLKDLITNHKELEKAYNIVLNEHYSTEIMHDIPTKMRDMGSLTIPCEFGNATECNALADSGASINLMSFSFYKKLNLPYLKPTRMTIRMENRSITYPQGIVEDLLVKIGKFFFPIEFMFLDMKEDEDLPIILGRHFLSIARVLVDI